MSFKFDSNQPYQLDAINAVVSIFDGQPGNAEQLVTTLRGTSAPQEGAEVGAFDIDLTQEVGAIGNNLVLNNDVILDNLQQAQDRSGLEVSPRLFDTEHLDFDIEMETGTGKTYVYLRTMFELAKHYNFKKFIILVPSVAIREGVLTSIKLMKKHFMDLYPGQPFDHGVYAGKNAEDVAAFATSTNMQILVMTMASIAEKASAKAGDGEGDEEARLIINQRRDKLNGYRPIDYLAATRPIVIMDEPQNMESGLQSDALKRLKPSFALRYSATHKTQRNVVYKLDPVDAHELGLVKTIVVSDVQQQGADVTPYIKLISVKNTGKFVAQLELSGRSADGGLERKKVSVGSGTELSDARVSGNPAYSGWRINSLSLADGSNPGSIELTLHDELVYEGESIGGAAGAVYREMIRETVREHFRKMRLLKEKNIKVLSLFFIDKVASYMGSGLAYDVADGDFVQWFDEAFVEERAKKPEFIEWLPGEPAEYRKAYFSQVKKGGSVQAQDSNGTSVADNDAYDLIMKDKEGLLSESTPARFIFSHSALREGWDNPNVFQICTLREMGTKTERRQTIGRGLRLPVTRTDNGFERVSDESISSLTVIANESYQSFARALQQEYSVDGVEIGKVRMAEFAKILRLDSEGVATEKPLGYQKSTEIYKQLDESGFIEDGRVTSKYQPNVPGFSLGLSSEYSHYEPEVIALLGRASIERYVKPKSQRISRSLNKEIYASPEFEQLWEAISGKTTYSVKLSTEDLIKEAVKQVKEAEPIQALRIEVTQAGISVQRGGAKATAKNTSTTELKGSYDLPDIVTELQESTSLTRATIIDILIKSDRLAEFLGNPNDFIAMVKRVLKSVLATIVVDGVEYEKIAGSIYELRELRQDGAEEKDRFLDQMYQVKNAQKTDFDYVVFDSDVESKFAEYLDGREDVRFFMKLPAKFKIPTPVGDYNPDWAIVKRADGKDAIYMIRETKGSSDLSKLRPSERAKILSAKAHFKALGNVDFAHTSPPAWSV